MPDQYISWCDVNFYLYQGVLDLLYLFSHTRIRISARCDAFINITHDVMEIPYVNLNSAQCARCNTLEDMYDLIHFHGKKAYNHLNLLEVIVTHSTFMVKSPKPRWQKT